MHTARLRKPKESKLGQAERGTGPLTPEHAAQTTPGVVLRDGDSAAAKQAPRASRGRGRGQRDVRQNPRTL
jgi:hypothetical protein